MSRLAKMLPAFYFIVDISIIIFSFQFSRFLFGFRNFPLLTAISLLLIISIWSITGYFTRLYRENLHNGVWARMKGYFKIYLFFAILIVIAGILAEMSYPSALSLIFISIFVGTNIVVNFLLVSIISHFRRRKGNIKNTLIIGIGKSALKISNYLQANPDFGFKIGGYLEYGNEICKVDKTLTLERTTELNEYLKLKAINAIIIALPYRLAKRSKIKTIIELADFHGVRINFIPDYKSLFGRNFKIIQEGRLNVVSARQLPLDEFFAIIAKGIFDTFFSLFVLILLFPAFIVVGILIKIDSKGPLFYCPIRVGRGGKDFKIYKFRTMFQGDSQHSGTLSTTRNDPRITRIGKILRKYNLDELPQFYNVLIGEMSIVGPRPHRNFLNNQMKEQVDKYMLRHYFRPGITGWAQVNGWRGPTETDEQIQQRTAHDLWYIENWSFFLDLKIIWMTIFSRKAFRNAF